MTVPLRLVGDPSPARRERTLARVTLYARAAGDGPRWLLRWGHVPLTETRDGPTVFALGVFAPWCWLLWRWYG